ncbi:hypothetical protein [Pseudaestuariivita atlantica]|uniref:Propanediol utilization protein n=1 Tax=Pseudaestuariivita atlantica TaxID=1317121 RepID=A0A0L1JRK6_9RHOB|nr:hypothetical protein [Pseudaestuariivita atlantica]KNG94013.1 hypothetical protein ATO11_07065 [Pseudaestuariivita atlantica]
MTRPDAGVAGHFGEFLQGRLGPDGPVALVTLPCPVARARVVRLGQAGFGVAGAPVSRAAWGRFARALGQPLKGRFGVFTTLPLGAGGGMSTALLLSIARAAGIAATPTQLARACRIAEGASDPLMWPDPAARLWASRQGRTLARLPAPPRFDVVGGLWGPCQPTDPSDTDFPDIADLIPRWRDACAGGDAAAAAALASESASRCRAARGPATDPTPAIARDLGALGWAMSHTGAARALLFSPGTAPRHAGATLAEAGLRSTLRFGVGA